jgi:hypothetical protein
MVDMENFVALLEPTRVHFQITEYKNNKIPLTTKFKCIALDRYGEFCDIV